MGRRRQSTISSASSPSWSDFEEGVEITRFLKLGLSEYPIAIISGGLAFFFDI
jgi:hypothetical protein